MTTTKMTALEAAAIEAILASEYDDMHENVGKCVWTFTILDHSSITKAQLGGVLASLSNKEFLFVDNSVRAEECVTLLQAGYDAYLEFIKPVLACPECLSENVTKNGKDAHGNQKVKCKDCKKNSTIITKKVSTSETKGETTMTAPATEATTTGTPLAPTQNAVVEPAPVEPTPEAAEAKPAKAKGTKKAAAKPAEAAPKAPKAKRVNDIYERGLYTVTRMMEESGLEGKELNKFKFAAQRALGNGNLKGEVEQLTGRQWRRVIAKEDAHAFMAENIPGWEPKA